MQVAARSISCVRNRLGATPFTRFVARVISALVEPRTLLQALASDPAALAGLVLPRKVRVFEIGSYYILGRYDDEDALVLLVMYRLRRP